MCVKELMYTQKYILTEKYSYHLKVIFVEFISIYFHKTNQYCGYIIHVFFFLLWKIFKSIYRINCDMLHILFSNLSIVQF